MCAKICVIWVVIFNRVLQRFKNAFYSRAIERTRYKHTYKGSNVRDSALWRHLVTGNVMCIAARLFSKKFSKNAYFGGSRSLKVIDVDQYRWKARRQCLLRYAASLCLSATVFTLDEPIVVKLPFLRGGVPLFDALVRGESPHPAAPKLPH